MAFRKGMAAIKESLEKSQNRSSNVDTTWFGWNEGESKILRFLTDSDSIIVVPVHEQVPTVTGKPKTFVCRSVFDNASCELCNQEPKVYKRDIGYGIAVLREQVYEMVDGKRTPALDENGNTIYKDLVTEYETEVDGVTVLKRKPFVGIVSQGLKNFWGQISLIADRKGSLRDWDIEITRMGTGTATTYAPMALEKSTINFDKYNKFIPDVEGFLNRIGSQDYYDIHLHGKKAEEKKETPVSTFDDDYEEEEDVVLDEKTMAQRLQSRMGN